MENAQQVSSDYRRQFDRHTVNLNARIATKAGMCSVTVLNLSGGGAGLLFQPALKTMLLDPDLSLVLEEFGWLPCTVRWMSGDHCGVSFDIEPRRAQSIASALADRYDPVSRPRTG